MDGILINNPTRHYYKSNRNTQADTVSKLVIGHGLRMREILFNQVKTKSETEEWMTTVAAELMSSVSHSIWDMTSNTILTLSWLKYRKVTLICSYLTENTSSDHWTNIQLPHTQHHEPIREKMKLIFLILSQSKSKSESKVQFQSPIPKSKVQVQSPSLKSSLNSKLKRLGLGLDSILLCHQFRIVTKSSPTLVSSCYWYRKL